MNYKDISDDELIMMLNEDSDKAKELLYTKYRFIVSYYVKKYTKIALTIGIDLRDLNQEALVGFSDALDSYKEGDASLKTFISLCVERRIHTAILKASRKKNQLLNNALSLEHIYSCFDSSLADIISDNNENDPLVKITRNERYNKIVNEIDLSLSDAEKDVFNLMLDGFDYKQIAEILSISSKSVDNTIQRVKQKIKDIMELNR